MNSITVNERVWIHNGYRKGFAEDRDGVVWLRDNDRGVEVRMDNGATHLIPWSNITIATY